MQHKYIFLTVLAFLFICQTGSALQCYECLGSCKIMKKTTCSEGTNRCMSAYYNHEHIDYMAKGCATHDSCEDNSHPDPQPVKSYCCETDLCNSAFNNVMSLGTALLLPLVSLYLSQF